MFRAIGRTSIAGMLFFVFLSLRVGAQIAPGVEQSAARTATISGTVIQSDGTAISGADIRLIGPAMLTTKSGAHGVFVFTSVPYGIYRIVANVANFGTASPDTVFIKGDISVTIQYVAQNSIGGLKEIARVSTHSAGNQINVTSASIASVSPSEYAFQGNTSWQQLLNQIPGVTVGGDLNHGSNGGEIIPGSPFQPVVLSINGALPYETSVTLDGMPLINTSFAASGSVGGGTDLTYFPLAMFDTADVIRGPGANAPSIVDSIGGSFVLHAPDRIDKNQFGFSASNDPYGGVVVNAKAALRLGHFSATFVYSLNNSPGPLGNTNVITAYSNAPLTVNGQTFQGCGPSYFGCTNYIAHPPGPQYQPYYYAALQDGILIDGVPISTEWTQHSGAASLSYDITPSIVAQIFYAGSSANIEQPYQQQLVDFTPGAGYTGAIAPGFYHYIFTNGPPIQQSSSLLEEKVTAYIGKGVLRLAALQNNSFDQQVGSGLCHFDGQYTVYGTGYVGSTSPGTLVNFNGTSVALTFPSETQNNRFWSNNRDLLASYTMQVGSTSSIGISYVTSYYNSPDFFQLIFAGTPYGSSQSTAISETTNELRLHATTEVSDKLSLDASWYFARGLYHVQNPSDTTGNTYMDVTFPYSAPRLGAVWNASRDTAIRVAVGGGYALPSLNQLVGTNAIFLFGPYYYEFKTNLNLKPEQSFGFDIGTDMRLHHNTVLSFDLYRVNLYGQFFQSTTLTGTYLGLPLYTNQYGNLSQSRYEGINLDVRHDVPHGIYWHGALGLTRAYVVSVPSGFYDDPSSGPNSINTYFVPGINFDGYSQSTVPYANGTAQIGYRWAPEKYIDLSPTYYGNGNPYFEPAFVEFDAHAGYPLTRNVSLLATFRNITGIYGQNYALPFPSLGAPTIAGAGPPYPLFGIPYGPRALIVTANIRY